MVTKQLWITLQAEFWLQIFVEGNIYEKKIIYILLSFPYKIFKVTPLLALATQTTVPSQWFQPEITREIPTHLDEKTPCHLKQDPRSKKKLNEYSVTNDDVKCAISYRSPALFTEPWLRDSAKTTSTSQGTISLQGTVLQTLAVESAFIFKKKTSSSSPWNIYTILILKQCGRGFSRSDYHVESPVWCWHCIPPANCQRHGYA